MQKTRQRILDYLDQRGSASPSQLAKAFGMTAANVRHHLGILQDRGLVVGMGQQPTKGRGRPDYLYALASTTSNGTEHLTRALLVTLGSSDANMKPLAQTLLGKNQSSKGQVTQRLVSAVRHLEPLGYKPSWEARPQGPQMMLGRCPYSTIIADHPELCRMDAHLLQELLSMPVEQTAKLQLGPQRIPQCVFLLHQNASRTV